MKRLTLSFIFLLSVLFAFGNNGYQIDLSVTNLKDTPAYLAFYFNGKTYSKDTTVLDKKGHGTFSNNEKLPEGIYIIYFDSNHYFDILVGADQKILVKADTTDFTKVTITGASESVKFQELVNQMSSKYKEQVELRNNYNDKKIDSLSYTQEYKKLADDVSNYQNKLIEENKGTFLASFIKGTTPITIPEFENVPDSLRQMTKYQYSKKHFFDNIDLSDPRFLRTPYFSSKVDNFISKHIIQVPDSVAAVAIDLIEKSRNNNETFQTMTTKMMNYALSSNIMGMDAMWLKLADKYYLSGEASWSDSTWLENLKKEADKVRYNQLGMEAHNLIARDSTNKIVQLWDIDRDLTLVYFYEPSCGHCKKTTPVLYDSIYTKWKDRGFEVLAFYTQTDKKEWMDFVQKNKLNDWLNVWDPYRQSEFWKYYDVSATPGLYLVNRDKKIIAKKIDTHTLDLILEEELVKRKQRK
jgi:thiol-disulfide isomerase/thioredoxin